MIYLLVGYMWLFIHRPFEIWPWMGVLRVERIYMLVMLAFWFFLARKQWTSNRVNWGVGLMALAITLATLASHYSDFGSENIQNWYKILLFYIILISSIHEERDLKTIVVSFVVIMGLFEVHSLYEFICGRGEYRMGIWRMVGVGSSLSDPNSFAGSVNYGIPMLLPALALAKGKLQRLTILCLFVIAIICIALTGSRTGLTSLAFLLAGAALVSPYRWRIIPLFSIAVVVFWINIPGELQNRYLTLVDSSYGPANATESADSRWHFLSMAATLWQEHPFLGIGPYGFGKASGTEMQSHTLYAELLADVGLVGIASFLVLIVSMVRNFSEGFRIYRNSEKTENKFLFMVLLATIITYLQLLFMGLGGHNLYRFTWLWCAAFSALALKFISTSPSASKQSTEKLSLH